MDIKPVIQKAKKIKIKIKVIVVDERNYVNDLAIFGFKRYCGWLYEHLENTERLCYF